MALFRIEETTRHSNYVVAIIFPSFPSFIKFVQNNYQIADEFARYFFDFEMPKPNDANRECKIYFKEVDFKEFKHLF